jgi:hypothetical protein
MLNAPHLTQKLGKQVNPGSEVFTDALKSYQNLNDEYVHQVIDHAEKYVDGQIHTNGLENYWSLLKRCIRGTYVSVEPFHLFRYLDEQSLYVNYALQIGNCGCIRFDCGLLPNSRAFRKYRHRSL